MVNAPPCRLPGALKSYNMAEVTSLLPLMSHISSLYAAISPSHVTSIFSMDKSNPSHNPVKQVIEVTQRDGDAG